MLSWSSQDSHTGGMLCASSAVCDHLAISSSLRAANCVPSPGVLLHGPWERASSYLACKARSCCPGLILEPLRNSMTKVEITQAGPESAGAAVSTLRNVQIIASQC